MDDDDQGAAEAFQMELERRQCEEEILARCRRLAEEVSDETILFERECDAHCARVAELSRALEL